MERDFLSFSDAELAGASEGGCEVGEFGAFGFELEIFFGCAEFDQRQAGGFAFAIFLERENERLRLGSGAEDEGSGDAEEIGLCETVGEFEVSDRACVRGAISADVVADDFS